MTVSASTPRNEYVGNGVTTVFAYSFRIQVATDLLVTKRSVTTSVETTLSYPSHYSVSGVGNTSGGSITLTTAPASGDVLVIRRVVPLTQATSFRTQGTFLAATHEDALDKAVMIDQQQQDALDRSVKLSESYDPADYDLTMRVEEGKVLIWTAAGIDNATIDRTGVALPGDGRTVTTLTSYLDHNKVFNIRDFGASPAGTAAANQTAIQATIDAAEAADGIVYVPPGLYDFTGPLRIAQTIQFMGAGGGSQSTGVAIAQTILNHTGTGYGIIVGAPSDSLYGGALRDFALKGNATAKGGIRLGHDSVFTNQEVLVHFVNVHVAGYTSAVATHTLRTGADAVTGAAGILDSCAQSCRFDGVYVHDCYRDYVEASAQSSVNNTFNSCYFRNATKQGVLLQSCTGFTFNNPVFEGCGEEGFAVRAQATTASSVTALTVVNPTFESNNTVSGTFAWVLDVGANPLSTIRLVTLIGGRILGKGIDLNGCREVVILNPEIPTSGTAIRTQNSVSVLILGGRDDPGTMTLDAKTVYIPFNAADGGFYDILGKARVRAGTGTGRTVLSGALAVITSQQGTTAVTTEETLRSFTVPGNTLSATGKLLRVTAHGTTAANANNKTIRLKFGATTLLNTSTTVAAPNGLDWRIVAEIFNQGAAINVMVTGQIGATVIPATFTAAAEDLTTDKTLALTGQNGTASANDIIARQVLVEAIN